MAGKHWTVRDDANSGNLATLSFPPVFPGSRVDRAFHEGYANEVAGGAIGDNPHSSGEPEYNAYRNGFLASFSFSGNRSYARQTAFAR